MKNKPFSYFDLMHETGHALYEFGLPKKWKNQPLGRAGGNVTSRKSVAFY